MSVITREIALTYGGYDIGGSTARPIDGYTEIEQSYATSAIEVSFWAFGSSAAAFASECQAIEAAFRKPRQDLTVTYGGSTHISFSHTNNTGFDSAPTITKEGGLGDTARSRRYTVRIEFGMPANNLSLNGRRDTSVHIAYGPQRRRKVTISGVYTAYLDGATPRSAEYAYGTASGTNIATYAASVLSAIDSSATFELVEEPQVQRNETNKALEFQIVYQEIIKGDAGSAIDDSEIVNQTFKLTFERLYPGDSLGGYSTGLSTGGSGSTVALSNGTPFRPVKWTTEYECWITKGGTDLRTKWNNVIWPWLEEQVQAAGAGPLAMISNNPTFNYSDNHITATMEWYDARGGTLLERTVTTTEDDVSFGWVDVPIWTGNPYDRYVYQGPAIRHREIHEKKRVVGTVSAGSLRQDYGKSASYFPVAQKVSVTPLTIGDETNRFDVTDIEITVLMQFYATPETKKNNDVATQSGSSNNANGGGSGSNGNNPSGPVSVNIGGSGPISLSSGGTLQP